MKFVQLTLKTYSIGSTSTQFEYDANGNLKYDNRDGLKAMYLYDYRNRLIGVRPERWDQWWSSTTTVPQPGYVCVDNGEFSIYSANNVSSTYVEREIPDVSLHDDVPYPNTELSFDFYRVASIDCNRFYFYFMNSETGAYLRVHYYRRSHTINVGQYSAANGYEDIYTNTAFYEDDGNCKLVIATGDIISFYFDGVLKGTTLLDEEIDDINTVRILINEGHFHYDDIIVDQIFNAGTPSEYTTNIVDLDFSDGPYAQFADYYYNTNDERILTVKSQEAASYYPFKTSIYNGNGQTLCEYKINKSASYSFLNDYVYGNGQKLAKFDGLDVEYFHNNYLGSIQAITNGSGTVTWSRDYYPFGEEKGTGTGTDDANVYKFTGKEWDDESKFFYSWHRYYDPKVGRFVQVDPKWNKYFNLTPYNYCNNNPLVSIDPEGLSTHVSRNGIVLKVIDNDKDFSVYQYDYPGDYSGKINYGAGVDIGPTLIIKQFSEGQQLDLSRGPIDTEVLARYYKYGEGKSAVTIAYHSMPLGPFDLKTNLLLPDIGYFYNGYWMLGEDTGNYFAGQNAAKAGMSLDKTLEAAGALHIISNKTFENVGMGYYGETVRTGIHIEAGYNSIDEFRMY